MSAFQCRALAALLVLASAALHIAYLSHAPLDLAPDEAHYWQWSQQLDASYYSKGPLTAYLIRASCELCGEWSITVCGTEQAAVRLPAVLCGSLLLIALYLLTLQSFGREPLALLVVASALTIPAFSLGRTLMTIDAPYTCLWGWALVIGHRAIFRGSTWAWPILGLVVGMGILAKYTMLLWIASAGLFLLWSNEYRRLLFRPGFWSMVAIAALCCMPILWWNVREGWVTFRHVGNQAGVTIGDSSPVIRWLGPLEYVGGQFGLLFGVWFAVWATAVVVNRPWRSDIGPTRGTQKTTMARETDCFHSTTYLWFLSVPQFMLFGAFSLRTSVMINWPVTCYIAGMVLAAPWLVNQLTSAAALTRHWFRAWILTACTAGIAAIVVLHDSTPIRPLLQRAAGAPSTADALPIRRLDPTCRLRGWQHLANVVDSMCAELRGEGMEPIIAASRWTTASELAFYCDGHPAVYSLGSALWDRQSQFDLWRPNPVLDPQEYLGRTFIFVDVGQVPPEVLRAFDKVEKTRKVVHAEGGVPIAIWDVTICRGFRGFAKLPRPHY